MKAKDIDFTVLAVRLADQAGVKCSPSMRRFADVASRVQQTAANLAGQTSAAIIALVREAEEVQHPSTAVFKLLETAAKNAAAQELLDAMPPEVPGSGID